MKLKEDKVIFLNLLYRILLLTFLLQDDSPEVPKDAEVLRHYLDPLTKRVFLIVINGLGKDFLRENCTPFLEEVVRTRGAFGVAATRYLETDESGLETILSGRVNQRYPAYWAGARFSETLLNYVDCKCGLGNLPPSLSLECHHPDKNPLVNFMKFSLNFERAHQKSCLYLMNFNLDPVLEKSYPSQLNKMDRDLQFFVEMIENFQNDNKSTFIVTSSRGCPVGQSLSVDPPVIAWGSGIARSSKRISMRQVDIASMLCVLLGSFYPKGLYGMYPVDMMNLHEFYKFETSLYHLRHLAAFKEVDTRNYLVDYMELGPQNLIRRISHINEDLAKEKIRKFSVATLVILLTNFLWALSLISFGSAVLCINKKALVFLCSLLGSSFYYESFDWKFWVPIEFSVLLTLQNFVQIRQGLKQKLSSYLMASFLSLLIFKLVVFFESGIAIPFFFSLDVLQLLFNCFHQRMNPFVVLVRLLSILILNALPFSHSFGQVSNVILNSIVGILFAFSIHFLFFLFNRKIDFHLSIISIMIALQTIYLCWLQKIQSHEGQAFFSCFFFGFFVVSTALVSGTLLEKLLKVYLNLAIPVQMLTVNVESIFHFSVVLYVFTWVITESNCLNPFEFHFCRKKVCSEIPPKALKQEDVRLIFFFFIYNYFSYYSIGHHPDLHSFDLYVVPSFWYPYPRFLSYFLGVFKFFLPFFVFTGSFVTVCCLQNKNLHSLVLTCIWISDVFGFWLLVSSGLIRRYFPKHALKTTYYFIQQFATISFIVAYFASVPLLLDSKEAVDCCEDEEKDSEDTQNMSEFSQRSSGLAL